MTPEQRTDYKRQRAAQPYLPAAQVLGRVKADDPSIPDDIPEPCHDATWYRGGFRFRLQVTPDDIGPEDCGLGQYHERRDTDTPDLTDGWVDVWKHARRIGMSQERATRERYRWWQSQMSAEDHAGWYYERGMARGPANALGLRLLLEDFETSHRLADEGGPWVVVVEVTGPNGAELGGASLGGIVVDDDASSRAYLRGIFAELADEAERQARAEVDAMRAEQRREDRRERAWGLVEAAAQGRNINADAAALVAEEASEGVSE